MKFTRRWLGRVFWGGSSIRSMTAGGSTLVARNTLGRTEMGSDAPIRYRLPANTAVERDLATRLAERPTVLDFGADPSGATDSTSAFQAAIDFVAAQGGGEVAVSRGRFKIGGVNCRSRVYLVGQSRFSYGVEPGMGASLLVPSSEAPSLFSAHKLYAFGFENLEIHNDRKLSANHVGIALADCGSVIVNNCKLHGFHIAIETFPNLGTRYSGDLHVTKCMFRNNQIGLRLGQDSQLENSDFSANGQCGAYVNSGQVRILGCRFEWNRKGERGPSDGIYLHSNANEVTIGGCTFDRNAGYDVRVRGSGEKRPRHILVIGNMFKRAAWGDDVAPRASSFCELADELNWSGNLFQFGGHEPSPTEGALGPLSACTFVNCDGICWSGNLYSDVRGLVPLTPPRFGWRATGTRLSLVGPNTKTGNPWLIRPADVLASSINRQKERSWRRVNWRYSGDDHLDFDTISLERESVNSSDDLYALYSMPPVALISCNNVETQDFRDFSDLKLRSNERKNAKLRTRLMATSTAGPLLLSLRYGCTPDIAGFRSAGALEIIIYGVSAGSASASCTVSSSDQRRQALGVAESNAPIALEAVPSPTGDELDIVLQNRTMEDVYIRIDLAW